MMMETVPSATGICLRQMAFFDRVDGLIPRPTRQHDTPPVVNHQSKCAGGGMDIPLYG